MKIDKKYLEILVNVLRETDGVLALKEARIRDSFLIPLSDAYNQFVQDRVKVYEHFCDKNADGTPDISDNKYHFKNEVLEELNKELGDLHAETVELDIPPGLPVMLELSGFKPRLGETALLDEFLEKLKADKKK